jgi:hypothetical protein
MAGIWVFAAQYGVAFELSASGGHTALRSPSPTNEPHDNDVAAGFIPNAVALVPILSFKTS